MTTKAGESKNENSSENEELIRLNNLFANRYTDEDEEYKRMAKPRSTTPPIVDDWGTKRNQGRNFDNQRTHYNNNNRDRYQQNRQYSNDNYRPRQRSRSPPYNHNPRR